MRWILLLVLVCLNVQATAFDPPETITTIDGRVFTGITAFKVEPHQVRFIHRDGAAGVPMEQLPATLRKQLGYDPEKAAAARLAAERSAKRVEKAFETRSQTLEAEKDVRRRAVAALRANNFGGQVYWKSPRMARLRRDHSALVSLTEAGFSDVEAKKVIATLKSEGRAR